jgi:hypothetical protein
MIENEEDGESRENTPNPWQKYTRRQKKIENARSRKELLKA